MPCEPKKRSGAVFVNNLSDPRFFFDTNQEIVHRVLSIANEYLNCLLPACC